MNENARSNQEIHVLFEHGLKLEMRQMSPGIYMTLYTETIAYETNYFVDVLFAKTMRTDMTL